jgi:NADPH:quinone reductase-like Zn-dependent oxidoreductase
MKRWVFTPGSRDIEGLKIEHAAIPEPGFGEVRIRVRAVALNARDQMILETPLLRSKPGLIPLSDGAGTIDAVGEGVNGWSVGDRVVSVFFADYLKEPPPANLTMGLGCMGEDGVMAEYIVLAAGRVLRAPPSLTMVQAATLPCAALTAWNALQGARPIGHNDWILVLGAGNVSLFAMAFARLRGAQVVATTGQDAKLEQLAKLGAKYVVNYQEVPEWGCHVSELTGGVDRVLNTVGAAALNQSMAALRPGGEVAVIGANTSNAKLDVDTLLGRGAVIRGIAVGSQEAYAEMAATIESSGFKPRIACVLGFGDLREAFLRQISPDTFGKVVLTL